MTGKRLVVDIGGSNVRFALADRCGALESVASFRTNAFDSFAGALTSYLAQIGTERLPAECVIAAAGPVDDGAVQLTNAHWVVSRDIVREILGYRQVAVINDLEAVAAALPRLCPADVTCVRGEATERSAQAAKLAFNIGTGCGAAVALFCKGGWRTIGCEPGHMTLCGEGLPTGFLSRDAVVEDVLSGAGVAALYAAMADRNTTSRHGAIDAEAVFSGAGNAFSTRQTVECLSRVIGRVAGDLVLATGAWGGVYFVGSVAKGWSRCADWELFFAAFESKGKMRSRMEQVPAFVVERPDVALFGLAMLEI
jgi:glucokinase